MIIINASRNVQFLFFYITWAKFRVSFQSLNSHHRAPQVSMSFQNPNSIFHFINIISIPATSAFYYRRIFSLFFSTFKQHFQFLAKEISCLENLHFVEKTVKEEYVIVTIISTLWITRLKQLINKVTYIFSIS